MTLENLSESTAQAARLQVASAMRRLAAIQVMRKIVRHFGQAEASVMLLEAKQSETLLRKEARRRTLPDPSKLDTEMAAISDFLR